MSINAAGRAAGVALAAILCAPPPAGAQTPVSAAPGQANVLSPSAIARLVAGKPVRITRADGFHRQGILKSLSTTSMVVTFDGAETQVPFDQIARVEKPSNHGMKTHMLIGLGAGVGLGVSSAVSTCREIQRRQGGPGAGSFGCYATSGSAFVFLAGAVGASLGAGVGPLLKAINHDRGLLYEATGPVGAAAATPVTSTGRKDRAAFARVFPGKKVRITRPDGFRRDGVVQSISPTAVDIMFGHRVESLPFEQIEKVETLTNHRKRGAIVGFAIGASVAVLGASICGSECDDTWLVGVAAYAGLGAGTGFGIGALVSARNPNGDVVYDAGSHAATVAFAPILSRTRKGVAFTMTWR